MKKIKAYFDNIVFSHSVFALPFAYIGAFLASAGHPSFHDFFWVTVAMVGARSAAMALNNYIDLKYDKMQPRFAMRPMVTGQIQPREAVGFIVISLAIFLVAAAQLNSLALKCWPLGVAPLVIYPYTKRFTWACHLVLGVALAAAPVGAWIAIRGDVTWSILFLGGAVGIWIAGFDVIYGCQDVEFDKRHQLNSIPVKFGVKRALEITKLMHVISIAAFVAAGLLYGLTYLYYVGVALAAGVLVYQHSLITAEDFSQVNPAYFLRNGLVGILIFAFTFFSLI